MKPADYFNITAALAVGVYLALTMYDLTRGFRVEVGAMVSILLAAAIIHRYVWNVRFDYQREEQTR